MPERWRSLGDRARVRVCNRISQRRRTGFGVVVGAGARVGLQRRGVSWRRVLEQRKRKLALGRKIWSGLRGNQKFGGEHMQRENETQCIAPTRQTLKHALRVLFGWVSGRAAASDPTCVCLCCDGETFVDCPVPNGGDPLFGDANGRQYQCRAMAVVAFWDSLEPSAGLQMSTFIAADGARAHLSGGEIAGSRGGAVTGMGFPRCDGAMDKREWAGEAGDAVGAGDERWETEVRAEVQVRLRVPGRKKGDGLERWR